MEAFSRVPQRFIVKFDVDVENPPANVLIVKTILPQQVSRAAGQKTFAFFELSWFCFLAEFLFGGMSQLSIGWLTRLHSLNLRNSVGYPFRQTWAAAE